ncbi:hypothetical protein J1N35_036308 [Gossypium stocksii]|uniref:Uncharacterized protein n=1 Tax=Gossypium stocksii TaxID=47602 RepID=A0A9D3UJV8_9ROSI|nr:hypothetical protein J1N35_036308 [Gossypium stocksii]
MTTLLWKIYDATWFNLGKLIFQKIIKHADRVYARLCLLFPPLIFQNLFKQNSKLVLATKKYERKFVDFNILTSGLKGSAPRLIVERWQQMQQHASIHATMHQDASDQAT